MESTWREVQSYSTDRVEGLSTMSFVHRTFVCYDERSSTNERSTTMGSGHGRLRGAVALIDHRSRNERSAGQTRGIDNRETKAIIDAELPVEDDDR